MGDLGRYFDLLSVVVVAAVAAAAAVVTGMLLRRSAGRQRAMTIACLILLIGAAAVVLVVTVRPRPRLSEHRSINLVPFTGIVGEWENVNTSLGLINVFGNVLLFLPIGVFGAILARRWYSAIAGAMLFSALIEFTQYFLGRAADVDDVLLNTVGAGIGALLVLGARSWRQFARRDTRASTRGRAGSPTD